MNSKDWTAQLLEVFVILLCIAFTVMLVAQVYHYVVHVEEPVPEEMFDNHSTYDGFEDLDIEYVVPGVTIQDLGLRPITSTAHERYLAQQVSVTKVTRTDKKCLK